MAHASLGAAFVPNPLGEITHLVPSHSGTAVTDAALEPGTNRVVLTESTTGSVLAATPLATGHALFSRADVR